MADRSSVPYCRIAARWGSGVLAIGSFSCCCPVGLRHRSSLSGMPPGWAQVVVFAFVSGRLPSGAQVPLASFGNGDLRSAPLWGQVSCDSGSCVFQESRLDGYCVLGDCIQVFRPGIAFRSIRVVRYCIQVALVRVDHVITHNCCVVSAWCT